MQLIAPSDVLEIHLHELYDVVDRFVVVEAISAHGKAKRGKPLLWDRVKHQPRFARFADKVLHFVVDDADLEALVAGSHGDSVFAMEYLQEQRRWEKFVQWNALAKEFGDDDMIGFGDADEIASRQNVWLLKHCHTKGDKVDIGIYFALGTISKAFRTDFPVPGHPFTYGDPTFWRLPAAATNGRPNRMRGRSGLFLLGGMHATDYGYLPFRIAKHAACGECGPFDDDFIAAAQRGDLAHLRTRFSHASLQGRIVSLEEAASQDATFNHQRVLPWYYLCNRDRYPAWELRRDTRIVKER